MGEVPEVEPHMSTYVNDMTEVEQPDRKRQRGPRGVSEVRAIARHARAHDED